MRNQREISLRLSNSYVMVGDEVLYVQGVIDNNLMTSRNGHELNLPLTGNGIPKWLRYKPRRVGFAFNQYSQLVYVTRKPTRNYKYGITHDAWEVRVVQNKSLHRMDMVIAEHLLSPTRATKRVSDVLAGDEQAAIISPSFAVMRMSEEEVVLLHNRWIIGRIENEQRVRVDVALPYLGDHIKHHFEEVLYG